MNQFAKSVSARLDSGEHQFSSLQTQNSQDNRAVSHSHHQQQPQQHRFVQAPQFQQQFPKATSQQTQKSDRDPPVSPLQMSSDSRIASPQQTRQPMLNVPSIDIGLYRPNLANSHNFAFQQQNQISSLATKDGFPTPYDNVQNQAGSVTAQSSASSKEASGTDLADPEDSSNMIASIITKICFDLSSENQQQLQIAHTVGLRVYEALSGKMNQYKLEIQNLRRAVETKNRKIQILESLQQQQAGQSIPQLPMPIATNPTPSRVSLPESVQPATLPKQFKPSHSLPGFTPELKRERKSTGSRRKSSSTSSRAKKKAKTLTKAKSLPIVKTDSSSSSSAEVVNRWTKEQDDSLKRAVKKYDGRNWKAIAQLVPGRDHVQCLQRWKKVLQPGLVKGHWTRDEDEKLLQLIKNKEMHSWAMVAENIDGRTAKQCRERWSLNLDPSINRSPWTMEEDALLLKLHAEIGGRWAEIKQQFDRRTENAVKTRFKSIMRAKAREWTPDQDQKLIELRRAYGKDWAKIAKGLPGRSRNAIKVRSKTLAESNPIMRRIEYPHLENAATMNNVQVKGSATGKAKAKRRR